MRKAVLFALMMSLLMNVVSFADVLDPNWKEASLDELLSAQSEIGDQISLLRAAEYEALDSIRFSGCGTDILSNVDIPFSPSRVKVVSGNKDSKVNVKFTGGDRNDYVEVRDGYMEKFFSGSGTYTVLVEADTDWGITIEPVTEGGFMGITGSGPYVSDFFDLQTPTIVTISYDPSEMETSSANVIIELASQFKNLDSWMEHAHTNAIVSSNSEAKTTEVIIEPTEGRHQYCWAVYTQPGVKWTIAPKGSTDIKNVTDNEAVQAVDTVIAETVAETERLEDVVMKTPEMIVEETEKPETVSEAPLSIEKETGETGLFTFRGIPWYISRTDFDAQTDLELETWNTNKMIYRLGSIEFAYSAGGDDFFTDGGYTVRCANTSVAGYTASDTYVSFFYPIEEGKMIRDDNLAEFYFGYYIFSNDDYPDIASLYEDLHGKLVSLYGSGISDEDNYQSWETWTDNAGAQIRMYRNKEDKYITLGYIAEGADDRFEKEKSAVDVENAEVQKQQQEENVKNTDGL